MENKPDIRISENAEALSQDAANFIIDCSIRAITENGRFSIALSGGSTPEKLFALLATANFKEKMPWANTFVFWGDERCVPLNDEQNNAHKASTLLLDKVNIPSANIFPIPVNLVPVEAAKSYTQTMNDFFGKTEPVFDLILLGLGENGHTASLFPHTDVLHNNVLEAKEVFVEEVKMYRITFTAALINKARKVTFLVSGKSKAEVVKTVLTGENRPEQYPAQLIKPENGELIWLADKEAASLL